MQIFTSKLQGEFCFVFLFLSSIMHWPTLVVKMEMTDNSWEVFKKLKNKTYKREYKPSNFILATVKKAKPEITFLQHDRMLSF